MMKQSRTKDQLFLPMLFVVQFFTWIGMFTMWLFTLPLVSGLQPQGQAMASAAAIQWVGGYFAIYVTLAALLNLAMPAVYARLGKFGTHGLALLAGAAGLASMAYATRPLTLVLSFAAIAVGWASISSTPYALVTDRVQDGRYARAMGIFSFSAVIPQVVIALSMGGLAQLLSPGQALIGGGLCMGFAGLLALGLQRLGFEP
jgi:maltose/moltooligosaccharide transporter